ANRRATVKYLLNGLFHSATAAGDDTEAQQTAAQQSHGGRLRNFVGIFQQPQLGVEVLFALPEQLQLQAVVRADAVAVVDHHFQQCAVGILELIHAHDARECAGVVDVGGVIKPAG